MSNRKEQLRLKLGCIIREARCAKGYKPAELAEQVGITIRFLSAIESGQRAPGYENLWELIHCLGISADQIFYPELADDSDAQQVMRQYEHCGDRDKQLIKALLNTMYKRTSKKRAGELGGKFSGSASMRLALIPIRFG